MEQMENLYFRGLVLKSIVKSDISKMFSDEEGAGAVEVAIILLILVGLALLFKTNVDKHMGTILNNISNDVKEVVK